MGEDDDPSPPFEEDGAQAEFVITSDVPQPDADAVTVDDVPLFDVCLDANAEIQNARRICQEICSECTEQGTNDEPSAMSNITDCEDDIGLFVEDFYNVRS